jgi:hypothetical protein
VAARKIYHASKRNKQTTVNPEFHKKLTTFLSLAEGFMTRALAALLLLPPLLLGACRGSDSNLKLSADATPATHLTHVHPVSTAPEDAGCVWWLRPLNASVDVRNARFAVFTLVSIAVAW